MHGCGVGCVRELRQKADERRRERSLGVASGIGSLAGLLALIDELNDRIATLEMQVATLQKKGSPS
jgi:hypothetical protein